MKTIKPPKEPVEYQLMCRECKSVMQCKKEELRHVPDWEGGYILVCPHCQGESWFADLSDYVVVADRK